MSVIVSGYFDPLHVGHLEYFENAKALGKHLTVIVNSDAQAILKKGKPFMKDVERKTILEAIRCVDNVVISIDEDRTVCKTLELVAKTLEKPVLFCNGGDQFNHTIPEKDVCDAMGIQLVDGLGSKIQSSSWLLEKASNS